LAGLPLEFLQGFPYLFLNLLLGGLHLGNGSSLAGPSTDPTFGRRSVASGLSSVLDDALSALPTVGTGIRGGSIRFLGILFLFLGLVELGQVDLVPGDLGPCKLLILCLDGLGLLLLGGFRRGRSGLFLGLGLHRFLDRFHLLGLLFLLGLHGFHRLFGLFLLFRLLGLWSSRFLVQVNLAHGLGPGELGPGLDHLLFIAFFTCKSSFLLFLLHLDPDGFLFLALFLAPFLGGHLFALVRLELIQQYLVHFIGNLGGGTCLYLMSLGIEIVHGPIQ